MRAWGALGVLMTAYTISFVDRTILSLLIPPIQRDLAISDTEVSLLAGMAFAVFYTLMGIPLGRVADRYSRRNLIAAGIAIWCLMTAACGLARNFWQLFLARVGVGVGEASLSPAAYSLISDLFPKQQLGRAIAVYSVGLPVGSGLALLIGGFVIGAVADLPPVELPLLGILQAWQLTFVVVGLPGALVAGLVLTLREPERKDRLISAGESVAHAGAPVLGLITFLRLRQRVLMHQFGGLALLVIVVYGTTAWIPTFFIRVHGWSATEIGYAYGLIFMIFGTGGLLTGGHLADRWWRLGRPDAHLRVVILSVTTMTPCFVLLPLVSSAETAIVLLSMATFTSSLHGGVAGAALQLITPNELRGQMTAVYFFIANLIGLGLGPTAVAVATDYLFRDPQALGLSVALLAAIAGPLSTVAIWTGLRHYRSAAAQLDIQPAPPAGIGASSTKEKQGFR